MNILNYHLDLLLDFNHFYIKNNMNYIKFLPYYTSIITQKDLENYQHIIEIFNKTSFNTNYFILKNKNLLPNQPDALIFNNELKIIESIQFKQKNNLTKIYSKNDIDKLLFKYKNIDIYLGFWNYDQYNNQIYFLKENNINFIKCTFIPNELIKIMNYSEQKIHFILDLHSNFLKSRQNMINIEKIITIYKNEKK